MDRPQHNISIGFKSRMFSDGLDSIVKSFDHFNVLSSFPFGNNQLKNLPEIQVEDILILELNCPSNRDLESILLLREKYPLHKFILISMLPRHNVGIRLMEIGISAYLLKSCGQNDLLTALNKVVNGKHYYCADITENLLSAKSKAEHVKEIELTEREKEILGMLVTGLTNKQIANCLNISENTIKTHRKNIQQKFGVSNLIGMVRYACRSNLIDFGDDGFCTVCPFVN